MTLWWYCSLYHWIRWNLKGTTEKMVKFDSENLRSWPPHLSKMSENYAGYQRDHWWGNHQSHPETPGSLACQIKTCAQSTCTACCCIPHGWLLSIIHGWRSPLPRPRILLGRLYPGLILKGKRMTGKGASELCLKIPAVPGNTSKIPQRTPLNDPRDILTGTFVEIDGDSCHTLWEN